MSPNRLLAGVLSLLVPGLGQIVSGRQERGIAILLAAIVIGSLQVLFLAVYCPECNPDAAFWSVSLSRIVHDVVALWSVVFWAWVVYDATAQAGRTTGSP